MIAGIIGLIIGLVIGSICGMVLTALLAANNINESKYISRRCIHEHNGICTNHEAECGFTDCDGICEHYEREA